ncbi:MAG: pyridoxal-phosphate dependent enzyme [Gemmatimonadota bacterium]
MKADPGRRRFDSVLETIGGTPLIRLCRIVGDVRTPVWVKAESFNPGGSVKDRIGLAIIEAAEREGRLRPGGTVVEATAGNTGVGLAIAAAVKGYRCVFAIPDKMSDEKIRMVKAFGAEVVVTPTAVPPDHPDYYGNVARRIAERTPGAVLADQFFNPVNPRAHYASTGPEIWEQTEGRVTHFVTAPATGGTISGVARYLKERNPEIRVVAGDPVGSIFTRYFETGEKSEGAPYKVEGVGNDKIPGTLDFELIDEFCQVPDPVAFAMARRMTREEGLFAGSSSGLIAHVALQVAAEVDDPDACVVCLLTDTGERYLTKLYNDEWMRENRMFPVPPDTAAALLARKRSTGSPDLVSVAPREPVARALALFEEHNLSQLPVIEDGRAIGSVVESSLMAAVLRDPSQMDAPVSTHAGPSFPIVAHDADVSRLSRELSREIPAVLVSDGGGLVGILTRYDILHHLLGG